MGGHKARPYNFTPEGLVGRGSGEEILRCAQDYIREGRVYAPTTSHFKLQSLAWLNHFWDSPTFWFSLNCS
ncbi:MAG: hypothetical protein WAR23_00535, partial [Dethiobacteria bacterium]